MDTDPPMTAGWSAVEIGRVCSRRRPIPAGSWPRSMNVSPLNRRVLALDFGKRRIGLALSDELGLTAQGLETFQRTTMRDDLERMGEFVEGRNVGLILMGDPIHMSGKRGLQSEKAREFGERLGERTGVAVEYWDERLTTVEAQRVLKESGISSRKRARAVDRLSAVILLENYLEWLSMNREAGGACE